MKKILIVGDLHIGSVWGLSPPQYLAKYGNHVNQNEVQVHLWKHWREFLKQVKKRKYDTLILNGDNIDGPAPRDRGRCLMSTEMEDQVMNAATIIEELISVGGFGEVFELSGTDYHTSVQQDNEAQLAKYIDAEYLGLGPFDFTVEDTRINVSHGTGSSYWYRGTKMDKIGFTMQLNIAGDGLYNSRHIIRSHLHFRAALEYEHQSIYVVPAWQAQTDYMRKKDPLKMIPNIGSLELVVDGSEVSHRFYTYPHPPRVLKHITGVYLGDKRREIKPVSMPDAPNVPLKKREGLIFPG